MSHDILSTCKICDSWRECELYPVPGIARGLVPICATCAGALGARQDQPAVRCEVCGDLLIRPGRARRPRSDRRYCGTTCRGEAYRRRNAAARNQLDTQEDT